MREVADMAKKRIIGLLAGLPLVVALAISVSFILAADSSDGVELGESAVSLEESGSRSGQFANLLSSSFVPELPDEEALIIAREFVRDGMNLADVEELPTRIASAKFSGQRHDNGEHAANMNVRVVVFHDYPDWPRLPIGYSGPKPVDPRYTVVIDDHTRDVVFSILTWGREGDAKNTSSGALGGSSPSAYLPQESVLDLSNPSDLSLDYPWSASEQAQRDIAIERRDASLLPECTGHYFTWRDATREIREAARGTEPLPGGFWANPGCKGTPDRLVVGPPSGPGPAAGRDQATAARPNGDGLVPTPTPVSETTSGIPDHQGIAVHLHDLLPWCDEIERIPWPEGVPTPAPSGQPTHGSDGQPGNVRCKARPTETDTPTPGRSESDSSTGRDGEQPYYRPTLDVDYGDSWVANIPSTIGGYSVRFINTPKSKACNHIPLISLKVLPESADGSSTPPLDVTSLQKEIQSIPGVPEKINLSFSQGKFDPEAKAKRDRERNAHNLEHGCPRWGGPIPE